MPRKQPLLVRVQDKDGRGPFQPGWSHTWLDDARDYTLPCVQSDFPNYKRILAANCPMVFGCAVRWDSRLPLWFSRTELHRLKAAGFRVVNATSCVIAAESATSCVIAAESATQALVGSTKPFQKLTRLSWAEVLA